MKSQYTIEESQKDYEAYFDLIRVTKEKYENRWLQENPDVTGIGIGYKSVHDNLTDTLAIRVSIKKKSNEEDVLPEERIPSAIVVADEGVFRVEDDNRDIRNALEREEIQPLQTEFEKSRVYLPEGVTIRKVDSWHLTDEKSDGEWRLVENVDEWVAKTGERDIYAVTVTNNTLIIRNVIQTDVIEREYEFLNARESRPDAAGRRRRRRRRRKWLGGGKVGRNGKSGTIGAIVTKRGGDGQERKMLLTASHVIGPVAENDTIECDGMLCVVGDFDQRTPLANSRNEVDAVAVEVESKGESRDYTSEIDQIGPLTGTGPVHLYMPIRKHGNTTGLTYGVISERHKTVKVGDVELTNQIEIATDLVRNAKFCTDGDSGAIVVNNAQEAVGLLAAVDRKTQHYAIANPMQKVLEALDVNLYLDEQEGLDKDVDDVMRDITSTTGSELMYLNSNFLGVGPKPLLALDWIDDDCCRSGCG